MLHNKAKNMLEQLWNKEKHIVAGIYKDKESDVWGRLAIHAKTKILPYLLYNSCI